jgi:hypothetical protein
LFDEVEEEEVVLNIPAEHFQAYHTLSRERWYNHGQRTIGFPACNVYNILL